MSTGTELLTAEQAAELLQTTTSALAQWRHRRQGPPWVTLSPAQVRYQRADLDAWIASRRTDPSAPATLDVEDTGT